MYQSLKNRMKTEGYKLVSIDLFSGPGGLCTGFKWAGILPLIAVEWTDTTVETYSVSHNTDVLELGKLIVDNEIDTQYLNSFLQETDRSIMIHGDVNLVSVELVKNLMLARYGIDSDKETVDIVSGGAPCESFSMAGKRILGDERDDLFSNIVRIARGVRTKATLFENVKGIFSKAKDGKKGAIFNYICNTFEDDTAIVTYKLASRNPSEVLLKASDYGVPQARERLFLVGIRNDLHDITYTYPQKEFGEDCKNSIVTVEDAISDLPKVEMGEESQIYSKPQSFKSSNQERYVSIMRGDYHAEGINSTVPKHLVDKGLYASDKVSSHKGPGHTKKKQALLALIPERESMKSVYQRLEQEGTLGEYRELFPKVLYGCRNRRLLDDQASFTVTSHCLDEILHPHMNRAITPREAARLQSFPDWYQFAGPYVAFHGAKEQDRYEQIGDAIPPLLACAIAKQFVECIPSEHI